MIEALSEIWAALKEYGPWALIAGALAYALYRVVSWLVLDCFTERKELRAKLEAANEARWKLAAENYRESERGRGR